MSDTSPPRIDFQAAIRRLIERLTLDYGEAFLRKWEGVNPNRLFDHWFHELEHLNNQEGLYRIAWALQNLPDHVPSVPAFKRLCSEAVIPRRQIEALPRSAPNPERVRVELQRLGWYVPKGQRIEIADQAARQSQYDGKWWARGHIAAALEGQKVRPITLLFSRQALRLPEDGSGDRRWLDQWKASIGARS